MPSCSTGWSAKYGVPKEVIVAIWGLESGFGRFMGDIPIFSSLATLAYDCRRSAFFTNELMSALRIADRGAMSIRDMKGAWAGEIGQTQFLASSYERFAVDFDGDGRPNLIRSKPDVFASTANFLRRHGWRKGADWSPGTANYGVLRDWNRAEVYRKTIAYMATQLRKLTGPVARSDPSTCVSRCRISVATAVTATPVSVQHARPGRTERQRLEEHEGRQQIGVGHDRTRGQAQARVGREKEA
jgi:membrane-bound lytic murein transglycosylase B